jgi:signal peptidase I
MAAASRPRLLAETVALVAFAVVLAVGLTYLLRFALGPGRLARGRAPRDRRSLENSDSTTRTDDRTMEETPRLSAAEGAAVAVAPVAEEPAAEEPAAEPQAPAKLRRRLRGPLGWVIYLGVIVGAVALGPTVLGAALGSEYPMATISSGSMWPALKEGDVVLLKGVDSIDDVKVGDIVAFRHKEGFAIHRIVSIEGEQIITKGDANTREDEPIEVEAVIGKVPTIAGTTARIPYLGNISFLLGPLLNQTEDPGQPPQTASEGVDLPSGEPEPVPPRGGP